MIDKTRILFFFFLIIGHSIGLSQESVNAAGGNALENTGSVSFSIGQTFYLYDFSTNGSVLPGVQQPYEISVITGVDGQDKMLLTISVLPNPTTGQLILTIDPDSNEKFLYKVFDNSGKLIENKVFEGYQTTIDLSDQPKGVYYLKVNSDQNRRNTFKIIKN